MNFYKSPISNNYQSINNNQSESYWITSSSDVQTSDFLNNEESLQDANNLKPANFPRIKQELHSINNEKTNNDQMIQSGNSFQKPPLIINPNLLLWANKANVSISSNSYCFNKGYYAVSNTPLTNQTSQQASWTQIPNEINNPNVTIPQKRERKNKKEVCMNPNAVAARNNRAKKKIEIQTLKNKVQNLEEENDALHKENIDLKEALEKIEEKNNYLESIIQNIPNIMIFVDNKKSPIINDVQLVYNNNDFIEDYVKKSDSSTTDPMISSI